MRSFLVRRELLKVISFPLMARRSEERQQQPDRWITGNGWIWRGRGESIAENGKKKSTGRDIVVSEGLDSRCWRPGGRTRSSHFPSICTLKRPSDILPFTGIDAMHIRRRRFKLPQSSLRRSGAASLEYVLVLATSLPMLAMSYYYAMKIIRAVYEMTCALVCWPFM
jgi:hypothetical protein